MAAAPPAYERGENKGGGFYYACDEVEEVEGTLVDWLLYSVKVKLKGGAVITGCMNHGEYRRLVAREGRVFRMSISHRRIYS